MEGPAPARKPSIPQYSPQGSPQRSMAGKVTGKGSGRQLGCSGVQLRGSLWGTHERVQAQPGGGTRGAHGRLQSQHPGGSGHAGGSAEGGQGQEEGAPGQGRGTRRGESRRKAVRKEGGARGRQHPRGPCDLPGRAEEPGRGRTRAGGNCDNDRKDGKQGRAGPGGSQPVELFGPTPRGPAHGGPAHRPAPPMATPPLPPWPHLLFWVLEGNHKDHVPSLELQLVRVGGRVVVLGLYLQVRGQRDTCLLRALGPPCSPGQLCCEVSSQGGDPQPGALSDSGRQRLRGQQPPLTLNMNPGGRSARAAPLPASTVPFTAAEKVSTTTAGRELCGGAEGSLSGGDPGAGQGHRRGGGV